MQRQVIHIDEEKCDGCGDCVPSCHEGAIEIVDGKARLVSDRYCDGLGDCLAECPQGAIRLESREAEAYDEVAVAERMKTRPASPCSIENAGTPARLAERSAGCPGSAARAWEPRAADSPVATQDSQLSHWPVQLRLLHPAAPYLAGSDLLLCADCVPFAYPDFHRDYVQDHTVAVGCPKLDDAEDMVARLEAILTHSRPRSITVARMLVPCCGGIAQAAVLARQRSGVEVPIRIDTIDPQGRRVQSDSI